MKKMSYHPENWNRVYADDGRHVATVFGPIETARPLAVAFSATAELIDACQVARRYLDLRKNRAGAIVREREADLQRIKDLEHLLDQAVTIALAKAGVMGGV